MSKKRRSLFITMGIFALLLAGGLIELKTSSSASAQQRVFTGHENHDVPLAEAGALTRNFRRTMPTGTVIGGFVGGDAIRSLLAQPGAVGIRCYFAKEENGAPTLVLVGVDASGNDLSNGHVLESIVPCPPFCGTSNALSH